MILPETIDTVRRSANIVEIVAETVALQRRGGNFTGLCPFHSEKTPSFSVREDRGTYHCFGCGASGNVISFVMETMGMSFPEAVEYLAARYGIEVKRGDGYQKRKKKEQPRYLIEINRHALEFFQSHLKKAPAQIEKYCESRKLSPDILAEFCIGFSPVSWDALKNYLSSLKFSDEQLLASGLIRRNSRGSLFDLFRARLIFPILNERREPIAFGGRIVPGLLEEDKERKAPKYVNSPETDIYQKNKVLYGLPHSFPAIRESKELNVVEGYMDVISLWQSGVKNVVATCGTAVTDRHVSRISKIAQRVVLLFDGDRAGRGAAASCFKMFLNSGVDVTAIFFSEGEDPDTIATLHRDNTARFLKELPKTPLLEAYISKLLETFGVVSVKELGAASKGKVCKRVVEQLEEVENVFEKNELIRQAAFQLMVEESDLLNVLEGEDRSSSSASVVEREEPLSMQEEGASIGSVAALDLTDRTLLQAVIVHRDALVEKVLTDPQLCVSLAPAARLFIEELSELMIEEDASDEGSQKKKVMQFLKYLGNDWISLWKEAYQIDKQPETDFLRVFEDCRKKLRKTRLQRSLKELERQIKDSSSEEDKLTLSDQKIKFERKLRELDRA